MLRSVWRSTASRVHHDTGPRADADVDPGVGPDVEPDLHSHGTHGHDVHGRPPVGSGRRARVVLAAALVPALLATVAGLVGLWPSGADRPLLQTTRPGMVFHDVTVTHVSADEPRVDRQVRAEMPDGSAVWVLVPPEYLAELGRGDAVQVAYVVEAAGEGTPYLFVDFVRGPPLAALAGLFAVLTVLVARWRGLAALVGLAVSLGVLGAFTLPALVEGRPAVPVALVTAAAIMFVVLYLAHGLNARTSTALLGTLVGLGVTAALGAWASGAAHLTGLSGEYALDLVSTAPEVSLRAVLLCGIVIAGLGVLNDVTITQASAVWELHAADSRAGWAHLFRRGMRIGRDHIASTVYTVVFAYVGASLPLVLLLSISDRSLLGSLGSGDIAEEVARTLVGSIGLVLAIPVTTAIAASVVRSSGHRRPPPYATAGVSRLTGG